MDTRREDMIRWAAAYRAAKETGAALPWRPHSGIRGCDFRGCDLSGCDLSGCDLRGCDLSGCDLSGCDLSGCNLSGCDLSGCVLGWCNLGGCDLSGTGIMRLYDGCYEVTLYPEEEGGKGGPILAYGCARYPLKQWADQKKRAALIRKHGPEYDEVMGATPAAVRRAYGRRIAAIVALAKTIPQPKRRKG